MQHPSELSLLLPFHIAGLIFGDIMLKTKVSNDYMHIEEQQEQISTISNQSFPIRKLHVCLVLVPLTSAVPCKGYLKHGHNLLGMVVMLDLAV